MYRVVDYLTFWMPHSQSIDGTSLALATVKALVTGGHREPDGGGGMFGRQRRRGPVEWMNVAFAGRASSYRPHLLGFMENSSRGLACQ
jgi:hypothetical protein